MQKEIDILTGQNIADIAIQECGSMEALAVIASANEISLTEIIAPGTTIYVDSPDVPDQLLRTIRNENIIPATNKDISAATAVIDEGIGYWAIGIDFIVS